MDERELVEHYRRYGYLVHRRCMAILGNSADAEDAMQETFLRAQRYPPPQTESRLAWLYTVAAHCCFDLMKKRGRHEPLPDEALAALDTRSSGSGEDADRRAVLGAALRRADEKTRAIGLLHYLGGFTQEEVAERTGYSRKTVGKKLLAFEELLRSAFPSKRAAS